MLSIQSGQTHTDTALWPALSCQSKFELNTVTDMLCTVERCFNFQLSMLDPASARTEAGATTGTTASSFLHLASGHQY